MYGPDHAVPLWSHVAKRDSRSSSERFYPSYFDSSLRMLIELCRNRVSSFGSIALEVFRAFSLCHVPPAMRARKAITEAVTMDESARICLPRLRTCTLSQDSRPDHAGVSKSSLWSLVYCASGSGVSMKPPRPGSSRSSPQRLQGYDIAWSTLIIVQYHSLRYVLKRSAAVTHLL